MIKNRRPGAVPITDAGFRDFEENKSRLTFEKRYFEKVRSKHGAGQYRLLRKTFLEACAVLNVSCVERIDWGRLQLDWTADRTAVAEALAQDVDSSLIPDSSFCERVPNEWLLVLQDDDNWRKFIQFDSDKNVDSAFQICDTQVWEKLTEEVDILLKSNSHQEAIALCDEAIQCARKTGVARSICVSLESMSRAVFCSHFHAPDQSKIETLRTISSQLNTYDQILGTAAAFRTAMAEQDYDTAVAFAAEMVTHNDSTFRHRVGALSWLQRRAEEVELPNTIFDQNHFFGLLKKNSVQEQMVLCCHWCATLSAANHEVEETTPAILAYLKQVEKFTDPRTVFIALFNLLQELRYQSRFTSDGVTTCKSLRAVAIAALSALGQHALPYEIAWVSLCIAECTGFRSVEETRRWLNRASKAIEKVDDDRSELLYRKSRVLMSLGAKLEVDMNHWRDTLLVLSDTKKHLPIDDHDRLYRVLVSEVACLREVNDFQKALKLCDEAAWYVTSPDHAEMLQMTRIEILLLSGQITEARMQIEEAKQIEEAERATKPKHESDPQDDRAAFGEEFRKRRFEHFERYIYDRVEPVVDWIASNQSLKIQRHSEIDGLRSYVSEVSQLLTDTWELLHSTAPSFDPADALDFWGRGAFIKIAAAVRARSLDTIVVEAVSTKEIAHWVRVFCPFFETVVVKWKGDLQRRVSSLPIPIDTIRHAGCGCGYVLTGSESNGWPVAMGHGVLLPKHVATFLFHNCVRLMKQGRLVVVPAELVGCQAPGLAAADGLLAQKLLGGAISLANINISNDAADVRVVDVATTPIPYLRGISLDDFSEVMDSLCDATGDFKHLWRSRISKVDLSDWRTLSAFEDQFRDACVQLEKAVCNVATKLRNVTVSRMPGGCAFAQPPVSPEMTSYLQDICGPIPSDAWVPLWRIQKAGGVLEWNANHSRDVKHGILLRKTPAQYSSRFGPSWLCPGNVGLEERPPNTSTSVTTTWNS